MVGQYEPAPGQRRAIPPPEETAAIHGETGDPTLWDEAYHLARTYIEGLFDQYAPEISPDDRFPGVYLGAIGLATATTRYGPSDQAPRTYGGTVEAGVLATYHHAGHSADFIEDMFRYATAVNQVRPGTFDAGAFIRFPVIGSHHDIAMGDGRGVDEAMSADIAAEMMTRLGFTLGPDEPTASAIIGTTEMTVDPAHAAIIGTTWNPDTRRQAVDPDSPFVEYQRAAAVADLMPLFDRRGPYKAVCLLIEDMCKVMNSQIFQRIAIENGYAYSNWSVDECMIFVDDVPLLGEVFGTMLRGQADFFAHFQPADPMLDAMFPGRPDNAVFMRRLSELYDMRFTSDTPMTAWRCLQAARAFMELKLQA